MNGVLCCVDKSEPRSLCIHFIRYESKRKTSWYGGPQETRCIGSGTLTNVFRMLMYHGFDDTDVLLKCPGSLRTELLRGIKAHKKSIPAKMNTGKHPSGK